MEKSNCTALEALPLLELCSIPEQSNHQSQPAVNPSGYRNCQARDATGAEVAMNVTAVNQPLSDWTYLRPLL